LKLPEEEVVKKKLLSGKSCLSEKSGKKLPVVVRVPAVRVPVVTRVPAVAMVVVLFRTINMA